MVMRKRLLTAMVVIAYLYRGGRDNDSLIYERIRHEVVSGELDIR